MSENPDLFEDETPEPETLRDALEQAMDSSESEESAHAKADETPQEQPREEAQEEAQPVQQPEAEAAAPEPEPEPEPAAPGFVDDTGRYPNLTAERVQKAPQTWRPGAREDWEKLPEQARWEIHRRETDINRGMEEASQARKFHHEFQEKMRPYEPLMHAEGAKSPLDAVQSLMQTAATLNMGTAEQKAQRIVALINHYGVDVGMVDKGLTDGAEAVADPVRKAVQSELAPVQQFMTEMQQRLQQSQQSQIGEMHAQLDEFAQNNEFYEDVREEMADLIDVAAKHGRNMTLEQAYAVACQANPQIQGVVAQRGQAQGQAQAASTLEKKLAVSNAVRPPAAGGDGVAAPRRDGSIEDDIRAAMDLLENR